MHKILTRMLNKRHNLRNNINNLRNNQILSFSFKQKDISIIRMRIYSILFNKFIIINKLYVLTIKNSTSEKLISSKLYRHQLYKKQNFA